MFLGSYLLPLLINPLPVPLLCLLWSYTAVVGLLDHSVAYKPHSVWLNSTYHYYHHAKYMVNYSEMEWLDEWMGTKYHVPAVPPVAATAAVSATSHVAQAAISLSHVATAAPVVLAVKGTKVASVATIAEGPDADCCCVDTTNGATVTEHTGTD